jgi:hypothetical protein
MVARKNVDYDREMNGEIYKNWPEEKLVQNSPVRLAVVTDIASYHNVQKNRAPNSGIQEMSYLFQQC